MSTDKKVLNNIFDKIQEGSTKGSERYKNLVHFALLCKNHLNLADKNQGWEVEKLLEYITGFEQIAEDGVSIAQVGHKGDLKVEHGKNNYYPNVKSTMLGSGRLWLKTDPNKMSAVKIKVFDSSRTKDFSLIEKLKQIGNDLIVIHFSWHSLQLRGCLSVTSLQEIAKHKGSSVLKMALSGLVAGLFTWNKTGHYFIKGRDVYDTARHHNRTLPFSTTEKEASDFLEEKKNFVKPSIVELMD